ncbi:MAG: outer membrane beta-barrel protein [Flavisolibacter sp.]
MTEVEKGANTSIIQKDVLSQPDISKTNTETIIQKSTTETGLSDTKTPVLNSNTINPQKNTSLSVTKSNQNGQNILKDGNKKGRINSTGKQPSQNNQQDQTITEQQKGNSNVMADFTPLIANNSNAGRSRQMAEGLRNEFPLNGSHELQTSSIVTGHFERDFTATAKPKAEKVKKFYAGIMGGVDMTTVKFQKVENYGHDYGILLGYRLNKKWSVETGLYRSSKDYYSDGKYFNTKKIYLPPNTKITEVSGNCLMWEIPVNVKYDFTSIRKHAWFATAGLSSYIMKKEDYSYLYYYGSTGNSYTHYRSYKNASRNLFSVFQISGGYSRSIGKLGEIRIEPYLKLPIGKMGVGEMPLMSAGLHLGITRPIF